MRRANPRAAPWSPCVRIHSVFPLAAALAAAAFVGACSPPTQLPAQASSAIGAATAPANPVPIEAQVTLQDLMLDEVDYSADAIWDATGTVIDQHGTDVRKPKTDADWEALRHHAVVLLEATNLLVIPNRKIAAKPFPSDGPGVLSSDEIQQRIDANRDEFNAFALGLRAVAKQELAAIDVRDADKLFDLGNAMDSACEACHKANWYPHEVVPDTPANPPSPDKY